MGDTKSLNYCHQGACCLWPRRWVWRAVVEWYWQGKTEELGGKLVPVPLCPPQITHVDLLTLSQTQTSAMRDGYFHAGAKTERRYSFYSVLTSALDGLSGQRHAPAKIYPLERTPGTHCTGRWVGLRAGLDTEVRGKPFTSAWDLICAFNISC
jgi:hypothetical protein